MKMKKDDFNPKVIINEKLSRVHSFLEKQKIPRDLLNMVRNYPEYKELSKDLTKKFRQVVILLDKMLSATEGGEASVQDDARSSMKIYIDLMKLLDNVVKGIPAGNSSEKRQILAVGERLNKAHNYAFYGPNTSRGGEVDWKTMAEKKLAEARKFYRGIALSHLPGAQVAYKNLKEFDVLYNKFAKEIESAFEK